MRRHWPGVASVPILFYFVDYSAGGAQGGASPPLFYPIPRYSIWRIIRRAASRQGVAAALLFYSALFYSVWWIIRQAASVAAALLFYSTLSDGLFGGRRLWHRASPPLFYSILFYSIRWSIRCVCDTHLWPRLVNLTHADMGFLKASVFDERDAVLEAGV